MTPLGPVFAWKMVDGTVYAVVLAMPLDWSTFVVTDVFNSNKCFAVYK